MNLNYGLVHRILRKFNLSILFCISFGSLSAFGEYVLNDYANNQILKKQDLTFQKRFEKFVLVLNSLEKQNEHAKLEGINNFFNQSMYMVDVKNWGVSDYWANTTELLDKDRADCEDYVFAKYFALKKLGIDINKLKTYYVKSLKYNEPHMVLGYFENELSEPKILDNYNLMILPASKRDDLLPIKFFDTEKLLIAKYKQFGLIVPTQTTEALLWLEAIQGIRRK